MTRFQIIEWVRDLRQRFYPPAFRIAAGVTKGANEIETSLAEIQAALEALAANTATPVVSHVSQATDDEKFMADLATRLWRIREKMLDPGTGQPLKSVERSYRHLERLIAELEDKGIRIEDKTGDPYDPGMAVKVVSSEPTEGILRELVKETVEPAVYREDRLIQPAQIVVGTPSASASDPPEISVTERGAGDHEEKT